MRTWPEYGDVYEGRTKVVQLVGAPSYSHHADGYRDTLHADFTHHADSYRDKIARTAGRRQERRHEHTHVGALLLSL